MSEANTKSKKDLKNPSSKLDALREKANKAQEAAKLAIQKLKEEERKAIEFNKKEVSELLRREELDIVPAETWSSVIVQIKQLLGVSTAPANVTTE